MPPALRFGWIVAVNARIGRQIISLKDQTIQWFLEYLAVLALLEIEWKLTKSLDDMHFGSSC